MAKISLRAYIKEIDSLIDRGENAEAIAHCKYILKIYPKYILTYSHLGKAYLESQRDSEALDIFQRVLSVYPDDFIAHLSLSIIRQGEDNLDAAIFHMERAYEVQPSKIEVQNELRRLYGRRDGATPPRVRLTRGALVRMYERGELYRQAIAEIIAALAENPGRIDLQVVLCRMYYLAGQKVEATDTASHLLSKLPYCFEANRILAEILPGTTRAEDAALYQKRVVEIDPYFAFTPLSSPNSLHVPENAIQLDQLVYRMNEPFTETGWAQNLGISLPGPAQSEELPDWFQTSPIPAPQEAQELDSGNEQVPSLPTGETELPDFIRQAGFAPATGPEQPSTLEISEAQEGDEIAAGEIPEWLQSIAPAEVTADQPTSAEDDSWLAGLMQQNEQPALGNLSESVPTESGSSELISEPSPIAPELPDWLREEAPQEEASSAALPDWMSQPPVMPDRNEIPESEEAQPSSIVPDWLQGLELDQSPSEGQPLTPDVSAEEETLEKTPDWLQELSVPSSPSEPTVGFEAVEGETTDSVLPDWITGNLSEPAEEIASTPLDEAINPENLPEKLPVEILPEISEITEIGQIEEPSISIDENLEAQSEAISAELPDWLTENLPESISESAEAIPSTSEGEIVEPLKISDEALIESLAEISEVTEEVQIDELPISTGESMEAQPEAISAELPDWLTENLPEPISESAEAIPSTSEGEIFEPVKLSDESQVESLAEISEVTERVQIEELPISTEESLEGQPEAVPAELPDWLSEFQAPVIQPISDIPDLTPVENLPIEATDNPELPDWLTGLDQTVPSKIEPEFQEQISSEVESESPTIPDVVEGVVEEPASEQPIESPLLPVEEPILSEVTAPVSESEATEVEIPEQIGEPVPSIAQFDEDSQAPTKPVSVKLSSPEPTEEVKIGVETPMPEFIPSEELEIVNEQATGSDTIFKTPVQQEDEIITEAVTDTLVQTTEEVIVEPIAESEVQPVTEPKAEPVSESSVQPADMPTDMEAALAWMEALAARQGADDSTLSTAPEERSTEMPDWLQQEVDSSTETYLPPLPVKEDVEGEIIPQIEAEIQPGTEQMVEPLVDTLNVENAPLPSEEIGTPAEIELPISTEEFAETPVQEETSETSEWLQTFHVDESEAETSESELPDWLIGVEESVQSTEPLPETEETKEEWVREETLVESPESIPVDIPVSEISTEQIVSESDATSEIDINLQPEEVPLSAESSPKELLEQAQIALRHNDPNKAVDHYEELVNSGNLIEETIHDLREAIDRYPMETPLYQILGDAYMRSNRLQDAIDAYTKAEQLLR